MYPAMGLEHRLLDLGGDLGFLRVRNPLVVLVGDGVDAGGGAVAFRVALGHGKHPNEYLHFPIASLPRGDVPQEYAAGGE